MHICLLCLPYSPGGPTGCFVQSLHSLLWNENPLSIHGSNAVKGGWRVSESCPYGNASPVRRQSVPEVSKGLSVASATSQGFTGP
ncbi:hypothetical protein GDO81_026128 [Engystomops pustulosus]|uniref:Uncharacterized protein n=1 Tax=Engystomops pustulosus TaxID=76066 RepID=A0AAV6ZM37_ENGPU|nr:hypothetical protein GDO81_026128 [Engystomops pustulosus]